jgi:hypothetical protein
LLRWMQKLGYKNFVNAEKRKDIYWKIMEELLQI